MSRNWTATKKPMSRDRLIGCDALFWVFLLAVFVGLELNPIAHALESRQMRRG